MKQEGNKVGGFIDLILSKDFQFKNNLQNKTFFKQITILKKNIYIKKEVNIWGEKTLFAATLTKVHGLGNEVIQYTKQLFWWELE